MIRQMITKATRRTISEAVPLICLDLICFLCIAFVWVRSDSYLRVLGGYGKGVVAAEGMFSPWCQMLSVCILASQNKSFRTYFL
jgi:hypothetical protein